MDARGVLDQLLQSGKSMLDKGRDVAEDKLGVPETGENRDAMVSGLGKGVIAGGLLALLVGTQRGRSVTGKAIKYGSMAAVAGVAYKAYQSWNSGSENEQPGGIESGQAITDLNDSAGHARGLLLVRAMISAANADGHIDEQERETISNKLSEMNLSDDTIAMLQSELAGPLSPEDLASQVDSMAAATEVYMLSSLVVDEANSQERDFLSRLASALKLPIALISKLETEAFA